MEIVPKACLTVGVTIRIGKEITMKKGAMWFCSKNAGEIVEILPMLSVWFEEGRFGAEITWIRWTAGVHFIQ